VAAHRARQGQAADTDRERGERALTRGGAAPARDRLGELARPRVDRAGHRHARRLVGARDFGEHRRKRAAVLGVVAVRGGEVAIDRPRDGRGSAEGGLDHLGVHRALGSEMRVEPADRQAGAVHDAADAGGGQAVLAGNPARGGDDAIVGPALLETLPRRPLRHSGPMLIHRPSGGAVISSSSVRP
jgi:hypothetical protein